MPNVFNYKNKDYQDIKRELDNRYPDQPDWFKDIISSLFDVMYWYLDMAIQDLFPDTMVSIRNMQKLTKMFGYKLKGISSATAQVKLKVDPSNPTNIIPKEKLRFRLTTEEGKSINLVSLSNLTIPSLVNTVDINLIEGDIRYGVFLGYHRGGINEEFILPFSNIDINYLKVYVNNVEWNMIDDLINSTSSGRHFQVNYLSDGRLAVQFGDGVFGEIPPANSYISCDLLLSNGLNGNYKNPDDPTKYTIEFLNYVEEPKIERYGHELIDDVSGGSDGENIIRAKDLAIANLRTINGATNEDSIKALTFKFSPSVYDVKILPGYSGMYSVGVVVIPYGGGNISSSFKVSLTDYLQKKMVLGYNRVDVLSPVYVPININIKVKMRSGFSFSFFEDCIKFVCALSACENLGEYLQYYRLRDWDRIFSVGETQFASHITDLRDDYKGYLIPIFEYLLRKGRRNFSDPYIVNDLITMVLTLSFVDEVQVISPANNRTGLMINEITQLGSLSVSEI